MNATQRKNDMAQLLALMGESQPEITHVPEAVRNIREVLGIGDDGLPLVRDDAAMRNALDVMPPYGTPVHEREVTKLPEVHDPAGDDLQFHIPAGRATQVLGSREIDISRIPDTQNVAVTDSNGRALPTRSAVAREKAITDALAGNEPLAKLMRKYGGKHFSFTMSR